MIQLKKLPLATARTAPLHRTVKAPCYQISATKPRARVRPRARRPAKAINKFYRTRQGTRACVNFLCNGNAPPPPKSHKRRKPSKRLPFTAPLAFYSETCNRRKINTDVIICSKKGCRLDNVQNLAHFYIQILGVGGAGNRGNGFRFTCRIVKHD